MEQGKDMAHSTGMAGEALKKGDRESGPEIARCLAMMMIVVLHFMGKGQFLGNFTQEPTTTQLMGWLLESFAICAVNIYMMLSGYYLCYSQFKISRLLQLFLQLVTYSVGVGAVGYLLGFAPEYAGSMSIKIQVLFPFLSGQYWFISVYFFLYLLLPFLGEGVRRLNKRSLQVIIILLLAVFCFSKTFLPFRLEIDKRGYDLNWYVTEFIIAAYIRRFGMPILEKRRLRAIFLYVVSSLGIFGLTYALQQVYLHTGRLGTWITIAWDYNHLLTFLAGLGFFMAFVGKGKKSREKEKKKNFFCKMAVWAGPYTLGVYLLHESIAVRFVWPTWVGAGSIASPLGLFAGTLAAVVAVFTVGILVEWIRCKLMQALHRLLLSVRLYARGMEQLKKLDACFAWKEAGKEAVE